MTTDIRYPDDFIDRLHAIWGEGFLSPGGVEEVHQIVKGLDLAGKTVLDIGFGTAGPAIVLARELGALVIYDDIQAGCGRTGSYFSFDDMDLDPDIVTLAKSLSGGFVPVGATVTRKWIFDAVFDDFREALARTTHGGTS